MAERETSPPLRVLFDSLSSLDGPSEREAFLDFTCRDDPGLRTRLERLLALRHEAQDFFDIEAPAAAAPDDNPDAGRGDEDEGTRIGRYRLLGRLGEGGCGVVYLAEQLEPVRRRVALKIIRLGMDTENVIARFELERQALAMMDHPNIARVLDVGATGTGRPYFVMQLVDGERITEFCDGKRLGIPERLSLFSRVCHAVQHAHQKGVIHRDIKPSNILVWEHDGEAVPKVIDFGIAKATAGGSDLQATFTVDGQFIGTPTYMSPEQASGAGLDVDTRSDVYSLGALLYELLSGRPPFDPEELREAGVDEIRRLLREVDPPAPSAAAEALGAERLRETAGRRNLEPHRFVAQLRGDLDRIVMKAMAKDRQRRYSGADALAADVACFLNHEPVSARPPGGFYRLAKLVRRNKGVFAAGGVVLLSLVLGLGAATAMYFQANRDRAAAEEARANEAALREEAEIGQKIAQAAVLVRYDRFREADELLEGIPPRMAEPSLESAETFQALGFWHAKEEHWEKAAERFTALAYSLTEADESDTDAVSLRLQPAAASLCEAGDLAGYQRLRRMAVERFGDTSHPIVAEQVVKACLLRPAGGEFLARLDPLESLMLAAQESAQGDEEADQNLVAWREFAIGLIEYRKGDFERCAEWLERCAASPSKNLARDAIRRAVLAMVFYRENRVIEAEAELAASRRILTERIAREPGIFEEWEPMWQDWVNARILVREAEAMMEGRDGGSP